MKLHQPIMLFLLFVFAALTLPAQENKKHSNCVALAEQSQNRIAIANVKTRKIVWEWKPSDSNVAPEHYRWFTNPSDAKVVYGGNYILMSASGGACALIRISDKKTMFYAKAGKNPHSAELLPDGNIVCAASTGNCLTVFKTDTITFPDRVTQHSFFCDDAHNVVWDKKRDLLWTGGQHKIISWKYNPLGQDPVLSAVDSIEFQDQYGHDLFPVPGKDKLYFTATHKNWIFNVRKKQLTEMKSKYKSLKSISAEKKGKTPIIIVPKEQWWTDEILDLKGNSILRIPGLKIYKARWMVLNAFSYPKKDRIKICD